MVCVVCAVLVSSEAGLCFASCNFAPPLVLCEVAPWCDLPWCGMWYVVLVSCEAGIRYTSVGLSSTKVTVAHSPPVTEALPVDMDGDPHNLLQYKGVALVAFV